jgi:tripartite-type tricarboxylate transporter receptor subunit TctC
MFKRTAGINLVHVPYKNSPLIDVMSGQVDLMFDSPLLVLSNKEKLRPLATAGAKRNQKLPDVPAIAESFPGFELTGWLGAFVAAGTPLEVVSYLHQEMAAVINGPDFKRRVEDQALDIGGNSPAEFTKFIESMSEKVGDVIRAANIKAD